MTIYIRQRNVDPNRTKKTRIDYSSEPNQTKKYNQKMPNGKGSKIVKWSIIGLLGIGCANACLSYNSYRRSLNWSTNRDALKMANMPIDTLTDTGKQADYKQRFVLLANEAIKPDGELNINAKGMKRLQKALAKIKTARPLYVEKYKKIEQKYLIRKKLNGLFLNKSTLKSSSTPHKVYDVLEDISPELNSIYMKNPHDAFVKKQIKRVHYLVKDTNLLSKITNELAGVIYTKNGVMYPIASLTPSKYADIYSQFDHLHYQWKYLDKFKDSSVQDKINIVLQKQGEKIDAYNDWQNDLKQKRQAYAKLAKDRQKHKEHYLDEQAKKRREKEKREKEAARAEREREEAEAQQKAQETAEAQQRANAEKQSSANTASSSSSSSTSNSNSAQRSDSSEQQVAKPTYKVTTPTKRKPKQTKRPKTDDEAVNTKDDSDNGNNDENNENE